MSEHPQTTSFDANQQLGTLGVVGEYRSPDGTEATSAGIFQERREAGGSVTCGGKQYQGPYTEDVTNAPGPGFLGIRGWGYAVLTTFTASASSKMGSTGRQTCTEDAGTYSMICTRGFVDQVKTGTYTSRADGSLSLN
jgi:hypothetical protein